MNCKNCHHEIQENDGLCPDCGQPVNSGEGKGLLIAGRILLAVAFAAALITLILFISTTVENGQDHILEAVRDFRREKSGTIAFLIAFLTALGSYLLLLAHDRKYGKPVRFAVLINVARILVAAEGILVIIGALIGN